MLRAITDALNLVLARQHVLAVLGNGDLGLCTLENIKVRAWLSSAMGTTAQSAAAA